MLFISLQWFGYSGQARSFLTNFIVKVGQWYFMLTLFCAHTHSNARLSLTFRY